LRCHAKHLAADKGRKPAKKIISMSPIMTPVTLADWVNISTGKGKGFQGTYRFDHEGIEEEIRYL
jgi:hypothetical protein